MIKESHLDLVSLYYGHDYRDLETRLLEGGRSNANIDVMGTRIHQVVRVPGTGSVDRPSEGANIAALTACERPLPIAKYSLYVVSGRNVLPVDDSSDYSGFPTGFAVMDFLKGVSLTGELFKDPKVQEAVARAYWTIHSSGVEFVNPASPFIEIGVYQKIIANQNTGYLPNDILQILRDMGGLSISLKERWIEAPRLSFGYPKLLHADPEFPNYIIADKANILDWEYGGRSKDWLYDVAGLLAENAHEIEPDTAHSWLDTVSRQYGIEVNPVAIKQRSFANLLVTVFYGAARAVEVSEDERPRFFLYTREKYELIKVEAPHIGL